MEEGHLGVAALIEVEFSEAEGAWQLVAGLFGPRAYNGGLRVGSDFCRYFLVLVFEGRVISEVDFYVVHHF